MENDNSDPRHNKQIVFVSISIIMRIHSKNWDMYFISQGSSASNKKPCGAARFKAMKDTFFEWAPRMRYDTLCVIDFGWRGRYMTDDQAKSFAGELERIPDTILCVQTLTSKQMTIGNARGATITVLLACTRSTFHLDSDDGAFTQLWNGQFGDNEIATMAEDYDMTEFGVSQEQPAKE